jgi:GTP pyrophosphokinase
MLGTAGLLVNLAKCCSPLPGDPIIGFVTRGGGVTVHRDTCNNVSRVAEPERLLECDWGPRTSVYAARVQVHAWDRVGLLRDISTILANGQANMVGVRTEEHSDRTTIVHLTIETEGGAEFVNLLSALDGVRGVISVHRVQG